MREGRTSRTVEQIQRRERFSRTVEHERMPPRNLSDESRILDRAEFWLEKLALAQLKTLQDMVATFGPGVQMATLGEDKISTN